MLKTWCCWGTEYCKCGCLGLTRNQNIKLTYLLLIFISYTQIIVIGMINDPSQASLSKYDCLQKQCYWQQLLFRVSLSLSIMHLILFFIMLLRNQTSKIMNEGAWILKIILVVVCSLMFVFLIPSSILHPIHQISQYLAILWCVIQNLILIDFFYTLDGFFKELTEQSPKIHILKAILSFIVVGVAVYFNVMTYLHRGSQSAFLPVTCSVLLLIGFILVFLRIFQGNTLLVFGLVMAYINLQAMWIMKHKEHETGEKEDEQSMFESIFQISTIFFCLFLILSPGSNKIRTKKSTINQILALNTSKEEEDTRYVSSNKWIIFHYIFFIICFILPTAVSMNTPISSEYQQKYENLDNLYEIYKHINLLFALAAYIWTLVTARLYPEQDFSQLQNYFKEYELN